MTKSSNTNRPNTFMSRTELRRQKKRKKSKKAQLVKRVLSMMLKVTLYSEDCNLIKVVIAPGIHLFPSRTEKLSPVTPMVLRKWESRQPPLKSPRQQKLPRRCFFVYLPHISLDLLLWYNGQKWLVKPRIIH